MHTHRATAAVGEARKHIIIGASVSSVWLIIKFNCHSGTMPVLRNVEA